MALTYEQSITLRNSINADPVLSALSLSNFNSQQIANAYNLPSVTNIWATNANTGAIYDAIDTTKYTPNDVPLLGDSPAQAALLLNRAQLLMIKQMVLAQLLGRDTIDMTKAATRAGLRDAVIGLPSGASGAAVSAGGAGGATALEAGMRKATRFEELYATADANTGPSTAKLPTIQGEVSMMEVQTARELA